MDLSGSACTQGRGSSMDLAAPGVSPGCSGARPRMIAPGPATGDLDRRYRPWRTIRFGGGKFSPEVRPAAGRTGSLREALQLPVPGWSVCGPVFRMKPSVERSEPSKPGKSGAFPERSPERSCDGSSLGVEEPRGVPAHGHAKSLVTLRSSIDHCQRKRSAARAELKLSGDSQGALM
jgi:hypothetical protein